MLYSYFAETNILHLLIADDGCDGALYENYVTSFHKAGCGANEKHAQISSFYLGKGVVYRTPPVYTAVVYLHTVEY